MRWTSISLLSVVVLAGCDGVFKLTRVDPPIDAAPDAPPDASIDAPTMVECKSSPIILRPDGNSTGAWRDQVPPTGAHVDKIWEEVADDDLSYIVTEADGVLELFTHVPAASTVKIDSVTIWVRARIEETSELPSVGPAFLPVPGPGLEWDDRYLMTSWTEISSGVYVNNPSTGMPWTVEELNATTFGVRKTYTTAPVRVTQIWASVACH